MGLPPPHVSRAGGAPDGGPALRKQEAPTRRKNSHRAGHV